MKRTATMLFMLALMFCKPAFGIGEAGTYFNVFVPPSAENEDRDVSLVVTALYDSTTFRINDTGVDGDGDDTVTGMLMAGQSYVLYIRDNGVNDDANHAGDTGATQDGDQFIVTASKLVLVSQAAKSDWEHEWLPSTNKTGMGSKFFVYGGEVTTSPNDLNVMAYSDSTYVSIYKISTEAHTGTGYTQVSVPNDSLVAQFMLNPGQDIIYQYHYGRDIMQPGQTYLVQSNKNVTVQYGALFTDESDGGGYVPSANGTGTGSQFYFAVPFEDSAQQEIRIVNWSDSNNVLLERYSNGQWVTLSQFSNLPQNKAVEWVGATNNQTYATVFRLSCTAGKNVSVFEGSWIETGNWVTSDIATMAPSATGAAAGANFDVYLPIPSQQGAVTDPFTNTKLPAEGVHAYIFGNRDTVAHVTVKDASTNGGIINRTYTIQRGGYVDCGLDSAQWVAIYNGTGKLSGGPQRPYLLVTSDNAVSVETTNFNDNWTMYFGSATPHGFDLTMSSNRPATGPGDTVQFTTVLNTDGNILRNGIFSQTVASGFTVLTSYIIDSTTHVKTVGATHSSANGITHVTYPAVAQFNATDNYRVITLVTTQCVYTGGESITQHTILPVETTLNALVNDSGEMAAASAAVVFDSAGAVQAPEFSVSGNSVVEGENVVCTGPCSETAYSWNFGDGYTGTGRVADHAYEQTGNFTIELIATTGNGCKATATETIKVTQVHCNVATRLPGCNADRTSATYTFLPSGIAETDSDKAPAIWSAGNRVYVDFTGMDIVNAHITIYNLLGQQIRSYQFTNASLFVDELDNVATGYLVAAVNNNNRVYARQVLVVSAK